MVISHSHTPLITLKVKRDFLLFSVLNKFIRTGSVRKNCLVVCFRHIES